MNVTHTASIATLGGGPRLQECDLTITGNSGEIAGGPWGLGLPRAGLQIEDRAKHAADLTLQHQGWQRAGPWDFDRGLYWADITPISQATPPSDLCTLCGGGIRWVDCPIDGWWAHTLHPKDGHTAIPRQDVA